MSAIRKLVGQTATYGLPTIVGRLLNYLLVPIYTGENAFKPTEYGVLSELYAWITFFIILIPFGMETTFFRFINSKENKKEVFRNSFLTVGVISLSFLLLATLFQQPIASFLGYANFPAFIFLLASIITLDAITAIPMAKLRAENQAKKFATIHFIAIAVNILLNLLVIFVLFDNTQPLLMVAYILGANVLASSIKLIGTFEDFKTIKLKFNQELIREMLRYSFPLVIAGFAGMINETIDRVMMKPLLVSVGHTQEYALSQVGIYSACYKLAMIVTIFLQAYRYAAEPFFFSQAREGGNKNTIYGRVMNYFVAAVCFVFLMVSLNIDSFKLFIRNDAYYVGLGVVPILLLANVFFGIYLNQSIWYKLSNQNKYGAYIAIGGAILTLFINFAFIPTYGYWASAWATFIVYGLQMGASYWLGQKFYPIKYNLRKFSLYLGTALLLFGTAYLLNLSPNKFSWNKFIIHNLFLLLFVGLIFFMENPLKKISKTRK